MNVKLMAFYVTGVLHRDDAGRAVAAQLKPGHRVVLERDVENAHDKYAIRVLAGEPLVHIGWVPRGNVVIANMLDAGIELDSYVLPMPPETPMNYPQSTGVLVAVDCWITQERRK